MSRRKIAILFTVLAVLEFQTVPASAQTASRSTATVAANAPIFIGPAVSPTPLRVAAPGTRLIVKDRQGEWVQVEFNDPQWGPRVGWVQASLVKLSTPDLEPMDLSVREPVSQPEATKSYQPPRSQEPPSAAQPTRERGFIRGLGGVTFGTETSSIVGGGVGVNIGPYVVIIGEFGRMQNVLPQGLQDDLDEFADAFGDYYDVDVVIDASIPAYYGAGGVRIQAPRGRLRPFAEVMVGAANMTLKIDARVEDVDISDEVMDEVGYVSGTQLLVTGGGGVSIVLSQSAAIDVGYRFGYIDGDDTSAKISMAYGALVFRF